MTMTVFNHDGQWEILAQIFYVQNPTFEYTVRTFATVCGENIPPNFLFHRFLNDGLFTNKITIRKHLKASLSPSMPQKLLSIVLAFFQGSAGGAGFLWWH